MDHTFASAINLATIRAANLSPLLTFVGGAS